MKTRARKYKTGGGPQCLTCAGFYTGKKGTKKSSRKRIKGVASRFVVPTKIKRKSERKHDWAKARELCKERLELIMWDQEARATPQGFIHFLQ